MYGKFGKCENCKCQDCMNDLHKLYGLCEECFANVQKERKCRACNVIFPSGNALFRHLKKKPTHMKGSVLSNCDICYYFIDGALRYCTDSNYISRPKGYDLWLERNGLLEKQ